MDRALWITWYDLPAGQRDGYCAWLQESYAPKLLARPGILWVAHYEQEKSVRHSGEAGRLRHTTDPAVPTGKDYILIVAGETAHAFARPVPGKFHAGLPEADRKVLAARVGARTNIMTEEARTDGPEVKTRPAGSVIAPCIQLGTFGAGDADEDEILAWYAEWRLPSMAKLEGCVGVRKLVSVSGWAKHGVLYEFVSVDARNRHFPDHEKPTPDMEAWTDRLVRKLLHAPGSPNLAHRIWASAR